MMHSIYLYSCLKHCGLTQIGRDRDYYDFRNTIPFQKYHLIIANGYKASIEVYKNKLLLCADTSYRLINAQNVFETMSTVHAKLNKDYEKLKLECLKEIVGQTVMTR